MSTLALKPGLYRDKDSGDRFIVEKVTKYGVEGRREWGDGEFEFWTATLDALATYYEPVGAGAAPSHDTLIWTWTSPTGQEFRGTPDYIEGVKTGWDAHHAPFADRKVIDKLHDLAALLKDLTDKETAAQVIELLMHPRVVIPTCKYSETCGREAD